MNLKIGAIIKRLRNERNMTQDELAEKLFVTRQAVSNWETKKTRPDVEMLEKISQVFSIDLMEFLYGKEKKEFSGEKIKPVLIFGGIILAYFLLQIFLLPILETARRLKYDAMPLIIYSMFARVMYGCIGPFIFSVMSLSKDVYIKNEKYRKICLGVGIGLSVLMIVFNLALFGIINLPMFSHIYTSWIYTVLFAVSMGKPSPVAAGILLYLGIKKTRV